MAAQTNAFALAHSLSYIRLLCLSQKRGCYPGAITCFPPPCIY